MQFQRLRLSGFKSFVDPTDLRIEPGLTGVVGPNGCGKSNLLEALRWVMGATSAKAMRGAGMDDVIFAGTTGRPGRNHAEVTLTIEDPAGAAPAPFARAPTLEVTRRIDRGAGSAYRVNGREARARDVQILFADASTGANSPALVRQGQISELIAAKPQNRRMILEEAAGVAGLHARRHEAELKVRAAEANLERLSDLSRELDSALLRLRREAKAAARYARLSDEVRRLQEAILFTRWDEARAALEQVDGEAGKAGAAAEAAIREAARASAAAAEAEAAIRPLRDEETTAAAVLQGLAIEKDRLERELAGASAELARRRAEAERLGADAAREVQAEEEAKAALARLEPQIAALGAEIAAAPERLPELEAAALAAQAARAQADAEVERLAGEAAAGEARRRAALAQCEEARQRLTRTVRALEQTKSERAALGPAEDPRHAEAAAALAQAEQALTAAREAAEAAEAERSAAQEAEAEARAQARAAEDRTAALKSEAAGLQKLVAAPKASVFPPALDGVSPEAGLEAALAAALGDDLEAALDSAAPAYWAGAPPRAADWSEGVTPLAPLVKAPAQLAARLAFVGLADRADGARLAGQLPPGARLVSREGDLWRWDGFTAKAGAPRPAETRLKQRAQLEAVMAAIAASAPKMEAAARAATEALQRLAQAETALRQARARPGALDGEVQSARRRLEALERESALRDARAHSLDDTIARFETERSELAEKLAATEASLPPPNEDATAQEALSAARVLAEQARAAETARRTALDLERRERDARAGRLQSLEADKAAWTGRATASAKRRDQLLRDQEKARAAIAQAETAPERTLARRDALLDQLALAEARRARSSDALAKGETARGEADRALRAAEAAAAERREARAVLYARLESARDRFAEAAAHIRDQAGLEPEALGKRMAEAGAPVMQGAAAMEAQMAVFLREREAMGPVNLRAEAEAEELAERLETLGRETADLKAAAGKLRESVAALNAEGRERVLAAFEVIDGHFRELFTTLFEGGQAELRLVESDDPLEAGLEIFACPPGKRLAVMSLLSGGEQALTAAALIFAVFLAHPAPVCVLDEVDAPLDDANVERFCNLLDEMRRRSDTRFIAITHNPLTMSRMDRLYGVTMAERGVSQLVSVDLRQAEALAAQ